MEADDGNSGRKRDRDASGEDRGEPDDVNARCEKPDEPGMQRYRREMDQVNSIAVLTVKAKEGNREYAICPGSLRDGEHDQNSGANGREGKAPGVDGSRRK